MNDNKNNKSLSKFEEVGQNASSNHGIITEFIDFIKYNKKWWLLPLVIMLILFGALLFLGQTGVAPFIYSFW